MTWGPATAVLLGGALLALPAPAWAAGGDGYRLHPRSEAAPQTLAAGTPATTALAFRAPHGYVFTVARAATRAMREAGAEPLYPEAGLWGVDQETAPALRRRLAARGLLLDATADEPRQTRMLRPDPASPEPFLPHQYMFASVDAAGLEPPPGGETDGVMVIDSGVDLAHAEFVGRPGLLVDNPQRVRAKAKGEWHGTAVTSTIGAPRNGLGIEGLYPSVRLGIWDGGGGDGILTSQTLKALRRAEVRGYKVVNMSFGGEGYTLPELLAVYRAFAKGILVVAATGNENQDGNPDEYPALFPHVLTVAAVDRNDNHAGFSNRKDGNDLAAPGRGVLAATPQVFDLRSEYDCDATAQWCAVDGTSFAAPIVSAAAAWVWAARPDLDVTQVFDLMRFSARDVGPRGFDRKTGFGVVSVRRALARTPPRTDPMEPNDEIILVDGRLTGTPARHLLPPARGSAGVRARLDFTEDPLDVYRIGLSRGDRVRVTLKPLDEDCDLVVWPSTARSVGLFAGTGRQVRPLARSIRPGFRKDSVVVEAPQTGTYYVDVRGNGRYDLIVQRLPRR